MAISIKKYKLVKRYDQDFWGDFFVKGFKKKWCEDTQKFKIYFKNVKYIQNRFVKRLLERSENRVLRQQVSKNLFRKIMKNKRTFFFRVDIIKLFPKRKKRSLFAIRLRDRHKIRKFASKLSVHQFKHHLMEAKEAKHSVKKFFSIFEGRLDVFLYRIGLSLSPGKTRQMISHGNFIINNKISKSPSHRVKLLDIVSVLDRIFFFKFLKLRLLLVLKKYFDRFTVREKHFRDREKFELGRFRMGLAKKFKRIRRRRIKKLGDLFFSIPAYLEVNYKIMSFIFISSPCNFYEIFYPYGFSTDRHLLLNTF
jgi:ribosomal protein S4